MFCLHDNKVVFIFFQFFSSVHISDSMKQTFFFSVRYLIEFESKEKMSGLAFKKNNEKSIAGINIE